MTFDANISDVSLKWLVAQSNLNRVKEQQKARTLLLGEDFQGDSGKSEQYELMKQLKQKLSAATEIFLPDDVQSNIYSADTGTHIIPQLFKKMLAIENVRENWTSPEVEAVFKKWLVGEEKS